TDAEIDATLREHVQTRHFTAGYEIVMDMVEAASARGKTPARFGWKTDSTYIRRPPY
ncbi:MAG: hypothetical protein QOK44_4608, partial [Betaproteobacteria bacterium]|nr:hypothetical protein [Betaproteobacteria bacterium]